MLLKSLKLHNFRQFIGDQEVKFENSSDENVTVILGKNTSGKTTLIQAFNWVLYGKAKFHVQDLLNLPVLQKMEPTDTETVFGEINLVHKNTDYVIRREQDYFMNNYGELETENTRFLIQYKTPEGQMKHLRSSDKIDTINKIIPEDLSEYFFFDGERIRHIGDKTRGGKKDISGAVESILGLEVLKSSIKHMSGGQKTSVIGKLKGNIDLSNNQELQDTRDELDDKYEEEKELDRKINDYQNSIDHFEEEIERLNKKIKNNIETKRLKQSIEDNDLKIRELEKEKNDKIKSLIHKLSSNSPMFFMKPLYSEVLDTLKEYEGIKESIPEMHADAIDYLIERGHCICGTDLVEGTAPYKKIENTKKYLPPESIGTVVRVFINNIEHYREKADEFYKEIIQLFTDIRKIKRNIKELESKNDKFSDQIENKPDVGKLEAQVKENKSKLKERRSKLQDKINEKGAVERDIKELNEKLEKNAKKDDKNTFVLHCLEYAKYINEKFKTHYNKLEKQIRKKLEQKANEIFTKMYHGDRRLELKENYGYKLVVPELSDGYQEKAEESEGLKRVASFAFISGIVDLAKEKIDKEKHDGHDEIEEYETEPFPLVMDAPFSNVDDEHVKNVSNILPNVAEQVIMIIMKKDWTHAEEVLNDKVNILYEMEKETETKTYIKPRRNGNV